MAKVFPAEMIGTFFGDAQLRNELGWRGMFTRHETVGAMPNGTRVTKVAIDNDKDAHAVGDKGVVLGSIDVSGVEPPEGIPHCDYYYFVEWDDMPMTAVGVMDFKIRRAVQ